MGFIDTMRAGRRADRLACRVLCEQGHQIVVHIRRARTGDVVVAQTVIEDQILGAISGAPHERRGNRTQETTQLGTDADSKRRRQETTQTHS